ncbi:hypothetical protein [Mariprofundus ferrooxydans]|uniref:hypothetical protein n=1 Tax=Mariprofundus ferrooxydans TaxID=314344 RepID=UPI00036F11EF|nr:hypothetical protein [Mariprofundus ferrooxydans]
MKKKPNLPLLRSVLLFTNYFLIIAALYQLKPASRSISLLNRSAARIYPMYGLPPHSLWA